MPPNKKDKTNEVHIVNVERGKATFHLVNTTPFLHNCLSKKAREELLLPSGPKTATEKKTTLKHVPIEEYRSSIYFSKDDNNPTLIQHLSSAFRGAMRTAALDLPGVTKAEIGRLLWVDGDRVNIFGVPELDMRPVRQAGMNRTPDIRTRCIMREWACTITVSYTMPQLKLEAVANLLAAAGMYIGVGDYRNEKGAGNYGLFEIVSEDDERYQRIIKEGDRAAQLAALEEPGFYNEETEELYSWYEVAVKDHRSFKPMTTKKVKKGNGVEVGA